MRLKLRCSYKLLARGQPAKYGFNYPKPFVHSFRDQLPHLVIMVLATTEGLSGNDSAVFSALFDPESSLSNSVRVGPSVSLGIEPGRLARIQRLDRATLLSLSHEEPSTLEIEEAVERFTAIIDENPDYAPAYVNRAQARRMLVNDLSLPDTPEQVRKIAADLATAIEIASPKGPDSDAISAMDAKVLASAHTHRGYLLLIASKSEENRWMVSSIPGFPELSRGDLEEMGSHELGIGGRYGNSTARQLAVKTNPYAKLCGSIVKEALQREISVYYQPQFPKAT